MNGIPVTELNRPPSPISEISYGRGKVGNIIYWVLLALIVILSAVSRVVKQKRMQYSEENARNIISNINRNHHSFRQSQN